jgi:hypothetical protein
MGNDKKFWVLDNYAYKKVKSPSRIFKMPASMHGHSYHSIETMSALEYFMNKPGLKLLNDLINSYFRAETHDDIDYSAIHYCPPISPANIYDLEAKTVKMFGWDELILAITDHDQIAGCLELTETRPELAPITSISQELTIHTAGIQLHLGIHNIPRHNAEEHHETIQKLGKLEQQHDLFDYLDSLNCLVIFNHPLWQLNKGDKENNMINDFIKRHRHSLHALEFNGMRPRDENNIVIDMAKSHNLSLIGAGDRHTHFPSLIYSGTRNATNFDDYMEEIKEGICAVIFRPNYFMPKTMKMMVRILSYFKEYREIAYYKNIPLKAYPLPKQMPLDTLADLAAWIVKVMTKFNIAK